MLGPIVDEVVAIDEVLAMRQGDALLEQVAKVAGEPHDLVGPCRGVVPWSRREDIHFVVLAQRVRSLDSAGHGIHEREDTGPK